MHSRPALGRERLSGSTRNGTAAATTCEAINVHSAPDIRNFRVAHELLQSTTTW